MDIRIDVDFFQHSKTRKLQRRHGPEAVLALINLWTWAAKQKPDGRLSGMDEEDIELASNWNGGPGFVGSLVELHFIDEEEDGYVLHNWEERNPWVAASPKRSNQNRLIRMADIYPDLYLELVNQGVQGLTKEEYRRAVNEYLTRGQRNVDEPLTPPHTQILPQEHNNDFVPEGCSQNNHKLSTEISTNGDKPLVLAQKEQVLLFLQLFRNFPGYSPEDPERESRWAYTLSEYFDNLDLNREFQEATRWIKKKGFKVRNTKAFITDWLKRVQKERRLKRPK